MNVSIAQVAQDVGTTVTGIQTAITLYTLVMATLMIPGGKVGGLIGRRRAFVLGCIIYACGSFTTALAPNLGVLILGWSVLEGIGAALIMPAIVALVASNFAAPDRPRAYGLVASAGAIAVAAGPLVGCEFSRGRDRPAADLGHGHRVLAGPPRSVLCSGGSAATTFGAGDGPQAGAFAGPPGRCPGPEPAAPTANLSRNHDSPGRRILEPGDLPARPIARSRDR